MIGSPAQTRLLVLIFFAAVVPAGIVTLCLYYLIFNMMAWQIGIPEAVAYNLIPVARKVNLIIAVALPISLVIIWLLALELSHKLLGPIVRLEKDLDERISSKKSGPIKLREKDVLRPIVDKINQLLYKAGP